MGTMTHKATRELAYFKSVFSAFLNVFFRKKHRNDVNTISKKLENRLPISEQVCLTLLPRLHIAASVLESRTSDSLSGAS